jgi:CRISPR-associated endonuclease Cas3-HD
MDDAHRFLAHSEGHSGRAQTQKEHLSEVLKHATAKCPKFLVNDVSLAALFHDFGKYSPLFKRRLEGLEFGLDHWTPGAHLLLACGLSELAGIAVHAHHVGLGSWSQVSTLRDKDKPASLENRRLTLANSKELHEGLKAMLDDGFTPQEYAKGRQLKRKVGSMLDARMVLSALVDADYADTARHMRGEKRPVPPTFDVVKAFASLKMYVDSLNKTNGASAHILKVRCDLWNAALEAAENHPGLYELEAPTGSGKTLAMLGFALRHMLKQRVFGLRRIVVALPFLSILDQTVNEYRKALGLHAGSILEHHSLAGWRRSTEEDGESEERKTAEALSENWEAPIIITTTVQLLESLFTDHPGTSRKLCALSRAVILLDEAQSIPQHLISPTLRAISRLCHPEYGSTVVIATATQPLFSRFANEVRQEGENAGWQPTPMARRTLDLYGRTCRYSIDWSRCRLPFSWETIANELVRENRALCIVNTRKDARHLAELVLAWSPESPVIHLSTNMCAAHRRNGI